ncbi:tRNA1(Val) (adenine(37)-N6)-methyltransferase [Rhodopila sp.]|uniref:tRNA1(Val) (adenine(37)-N6)-methyltransferase n=1 Tax=Rhodopila sp. TaxID=2480087 RepID=UPI003D1500D4
MTADARLLGGRVIYHQPPTGFRSGIEPVLLAASVPARPNQQVLEAGTGAGAGLLCLNARVPHLLSTGVEVDAALAALAAENARANGFTGIGILADPIETASLPQLFDHAFANPPYHAADGTASPDPARDTAKRGSDMLIAGWIDRLSRSLRDRGSLTLIVPAARCPACLTAMAVSSCPCSVLFPLWPKPGRSAKLVMLRGIKNARGTMRLAAGLVLHAPDGGFTQVTQAILAGGEALTLGHGTGRGPASENNV